MITKDLYNEILIQPILQGYHELFVVSGYSSATFLRKHLGDALERNPKIKIKLIIGMNQKRRDHSAYLNLIDNYPTQFDGYYYSGKPEVHSKVYYWRDESNNTLGYSGSANYSQYGFFSDKQQNQMVNGSSEDIFNFFNDLLVDSTPIVDYLLKEDEKLQYETVIGSLTPGQIEWIIPDKAIRISLLSRDGTLAKKSGLNWGQRPGRDPNQAYLSIRSDARKEGFLPEKKYTFTLLTDDDSTMDCTVQQDGRKAISTTNDNSELGNYFRKRLNVASGAMITKEHLRDYGRSDFLLKKLDEETFFLDFSSRK